MSGTGAKGMETVTCENETVTTTEVMTISADEIVVLETVTSEGLLGLKKHTWKNGGAC